ncbi:DUF1778 domain-containing protein [Ancylobacter vacuolatus]|uniref:Toxin-antitoxin system HicB family antitoxin n=1 Tax=Ancylobacter vacuolatus TaxID=223389 RepID=A0ABU0DLS6_9HYPH|nr:DUF1778 domain-containing protein [Ancylobacter vacuolatus]MDQ0349386.1 hypothetical protein [Ancylobacter vacuolatus]
MAKTANLALRIPPELKAALEEAAKADRRTVSAYVELLIIKDIEQRRLLPKQ